jgi:hypothetical protein
MIDKKLYKFLLKNETGIQKRENKIDIWVHVDFGDMEEFVKIVGNDYLCEGYVTGTVFDTTIAVNLEHVINDIAAYKRCFDKDDYQEAMKEN